MIILIQAAYNANEEDDLTSLFCSQLIAAAYQRLDIISKDIPSNNFVPSDFANDLQGQLKGARIDQTRKIPSMRKTVILFVYTQFSIFPTYANIYHYNNH